MAQRHPEPDVAGRRMVDIFGNVEDSDHERIGAYSMEDAAGSDSSAESDVSSEGSGDEEDVTQEWTSANTLRDVPFIAVPEICTGPAESPIDFFSLCFNNTFITALVASINHYAWAMTLGDHRPNSRINRWKSTDAEEILVFLGILFHMGTIKLNRLNDYWKIDPLFNLCFKNYMSRDRFLLILRFLCYQNSNDIFEPNDYNRHIKPIIDFFNNTMKDLNKPSRNLTISETVVLRRGKIRFLQEIKGKHNKNSVTMYVLTDKNGLCQKMHMHCVSNDRILRGRGHVDHVVGNLMQDYLDVGYSLYMNNDYNSVGLAEDLLARNTYFTGTLRSNRSRNPPFVRRVVEKGVCVAECNRKGVCVAKYVDKKAVLMVSTEHNADMIKTTNKHGVKQTPRVIMAYKQNIKGVERKDQMLSNYTCCTKAALWYKQIIIHIMQVMMLNAYKVYNICQKNDPLSRMSFYDFRIEVIRKLMNSSDAQTAQTAQISSGGPIKLRNGGQVHTASHLPKAMGGKTLRRRCKNCSSKAKIRRNTLFYCQLCPSQPGLCLECFAEFHNY